jgi:DNA-directed RNA polymerase subunit N (RpoN/RPB10)
MIIPVKCFTCGIVLGNKYEYYCKEVRKLKLEKKSEDGLYFTKLNNKQTEEGRVLDSMGLTKICCRRSMLTHVDIL